MFMSHFCKRSHGKFLASKLGNLSVQKRNHFICFYIQESNIFKQFYAFKEINLIASCLAKSLKQILYQYFIHFYCIPREKNINDFQNILIYIQNLIFRNRNAAYVFLQHLNFVVFISFADLKFSITVERMMGLLRFSISLL